MNKEEFDTHAALEDYHWWFRARRMILWEIIQKWIFPVPKTLLEIGCGTGGNLLFFQSRFARVVGLDLSPAAVRLARGRTALPIHEGDFRLLPPELWQEMELTLLADVLEHVPDDRAFVGDLLALMPVGGHLLVTVPAHPFLWSRHDEALGHCRRYRPQELLALFQGGQSRVLFSSPFNSVLLPAIALYRFLRPVRDDKPLVSSDLSLPPGALNALLYQLFQLERFWVRHFPLPMGVSHVLLLRKESQ